MCYGMCVYELYDGSCPFGRVKPEDAGCQPDFDDRDQSSSENECETMSEKEE